MAVAWPPPPVPRGDASDQRPCQARPDGQATVFPGNATGPPRALNARRRIIEPRHPFRRGCTIRKTLASGQNGGARRSVEMIEWVALGGGARGDSGVPAHGELALIVGTRGVI